MDNIGLTETETLEFKETLNEIDDIGQCLCAFANQHGGSVYIGVKNNGDLIGISTIIDKTIRDTSQYLIAHLEPSKSFSATEEIIAGKHLLKLEIFQSDTPYHTFKKRPFVRIGTSTNSMPQSEYQQRLIKYRYVNQDYSSNVIPGAQLSDLSEEAINNLRKLLIQSGRYELEINSLSDEQLLKDLLLLRDKSLTIAALVLLGSENTLSRFLPYAEVRYGYKLSENEINNQDTYIFKGGYLVYYNRIWEKIQSRNITITIPLDMRLIEKKAFDEQTIREAINNAIVHRSYLDPATTIIIQYPKKIIISSPGGFPEGVTVENIISETRPRNKLLADILFKCELVEQFGNGVNLMYRNQLALGKYPPDYSNTTPHRVVLSLDGNIQDVEFAKYVIRVAESKGKLLDDEELILLNKIKNNEKVKSEKLNGLLQLGLIERVSRNKYMLSKQYYEDTNQRGSYTKRKGLSTEKNKELVLQHLRNFGSGKKQDFLDLFKNDLNDKQIEYLLDDLKKEGKIYFDGLPRSSKGVWRLIDKTN